MQNQEKLMMKTRENGQKPSIWVILGPFGPILGQEFFFENRALLLIFVYSRLDAKNQKNVMMGSMRTGVTDGQTDGQTDGADGRAGPRNT